MGATYKGGQTDAFVSRITNNGTNLIKSIYLGTNNVDIIYGLKFDEKGFPLCDGSFEGRRMASDVERRFFESGFFSIRFKIVSRPHRF